MLTAANGRRVAGNPRTVVGSHFTAAQYGALITALRTTAGSCTGLDRTQPA